MGSPSCPLCGAAMILRETKKFVYHATGKPRKFYGCSRFPECKSTHGAHPDGRPLGIPADAETKEARIRAHTVFDQLWKTGVLTRRQAYRRMQEVMGMTDSQAHIGKFTKEQCETLIKRLLLH